MTLDLLRRVKSKVRRTLMGPGHTMAGPDASFFAFYKGMLGTLPKLNDVDGRLLMKRCERMFIDACVKLEPKVCLEIGAYEASFAKKMKKHLPHTTVVALEANPYVYEKYKESVLAAGVDYRHLCAAPEDGTMTIHIPRDFRGGERPQTNQMASLVQNTLTEEHEQVEVQSMRIDSLMAEIGAQKAPTIAWIDVEGALKPVLSGMVGTLQHIDLLYVETETRPVWEGQWIDVDVANFFMSHGLFPIARDEQRDWQHNWIFASRKLLGQEWLQQQVASLYAHKS